MYVIITLFITKCPQNDVCHALFLPVPKLVCREPPFTMGEQDIVKAPGKQTQHHPIHFSNQCAQRVYKSILLEFAYKDTYPNRMYGDNQTNNGKKNQGLPPK